MENLIRELVGMNNIITPDLIGIKNLIIKIFYAL